mmetsp:Transcript_107293/g.346201  ORF Transcript_107293/g.346201 Transcript_107293/m.346201 type:complete len:324 (+) Transcript_107293:1044-2015(+)
MAGSNKSANSDGDNSARRATTCASGTKSPRSATSAVAVRSGTKARAGGDDAELSTEKKGTRATATEPCCTAPQRRTTSVITASAAIVLPSLTPATSARQSASIVRTKSLRCAASAARARARPRTDSHVSVGVAHPPRAAWPSVCDGVSSCTSCICARNVLQREADALGSLRTKVSPEASARARMHATPAWMPLRGHLKGGVPLLGVSGTHKDSAAACHTWRSSCRPSALAAASLAASLQKTSGRRRWSPRRGTASAAQSKRAQSVRLSLLASTGLWSPKRSSKARSAWNAVLTAAPLGAQDSWPDRNGPSTSAVSGATTAASA